MKQSTEHTQECIAPEIGALLMQYELGNLSDTEREHFERHLLEGALFGIAAAQLNSGGN